jgi:hypothetical protein
MKSPEEIRKNFIWGIPLNIFILTLSIWYTKYEFLETVDSIINLDPSIRITPGAITIAYMPIMFTIIFLALVLGAIPCNKNILKIAERIGNISAFVGFFIMLVCIFIIAPLQYYAMPKLGYTRCNILKDHPTIYFTDWVRTPDWCVRGKSREWVREQARLASAQDS